MGKIKQIFAAGKAILGGGKTAETISDVSEDLADTVKSFNPAEQASKRQATDMLSDSKLSKAIRPIVIIWVLVLFSASLIADWYDCTTSETYKDLIFWALMAVITFYFPGR